MERNEIIEMFREAAGLVEDAGLPAELRSVAFTKAVDMLSGSAAAGRKPGPPGAGPPVDKGDILERIATKLEVDREIVDDTYELDDEGNLSLSIAKSKLESGKAGATKQIATLVAAGRQAAGIEATTSNMVVRDEVAGYGKYDSPNFAATVKELDEILSFPGSGRKWELKVRKAAFVDVGGLLKRIHDQTQG